MRLCLVGKNPEYVLAYRGSLIRAAQARGHEVHALTASSSVGAPESAHEAAARLDRARMRLAEAGVALHTVPLDGGSTNPIRDLRTVRALTRELRAIGPDAVFCYNPKLIAYGPVAARRAGVRRVGAMITGLGYAFTGTGFKRRLVRAVATRLYRRALRACDVVFFQNRDDLGMFERLGVVSATPGGQGRPSRGPRVVMVAGSGVDLERFAARPLPPAQGTAGTGDAAGTSAGARSAPAAAGAPAPRFVMIARLLRDKGAFEFVDAARLVRRELPHATFALVGGVDDNPTAVPREVISEWKREGVVELPGEVEDVRVPLAAASAFVLPSHREGTSKVMLEAMATGRAIVTTDAVGCRDPIEVGVNGVLVPVGDARALAAAMVELGRDRARLERMGRESRRIAEARYDAKRVDGTILDSLGL